MRCLKNLSEGSCVARHKWSEAEDNPKGVDDMRTRGILTMVVTICGLMLMCPLASGQAGEFPAPPYLAFPWKFELALYALAAGHDR